MKRYQSIVIALVLALSVCAGLLTASVEPSPARYTESSYEVTPMVPKGEWGP